MAEQPDNLNRTAAIAAAVLLAAAIPLGIFWTMGLQRQEVQMQGPLRAAAPESSLAHDLRQQAAQLRRTIAFDWIGVGAAAAGAVCLLAASRGRAASFWVAAAVPPLVYGVLAAAPEAVSLRPWALARLGIALAASAGWLVVARALSRRLQYVVCCASLGVGATFFTWWEPPPPKPVPIARHLALLEKELLARLPGWTGEDRRMPKDIEGQVGADEYLNLDLVPPSGAERVTVYITYNANAMSQIPHVPWVCMVQAGYNVVEIRQDGVVIASMPGKEIQPNVMLFQGGTGRDQARAMMFQYFRVGETYTWSRQLARFLATTGSLGAGSFLSQTQVAVWLRPDDRQDPMDKNSPAYRLGLQVLDALVPLLERGYYPSLHDSEGG